MVEQNFETVKCGNDQTFDDVLVDTGSAILWVGGENPYVQGPNTKVYVFQLSHSIFYYYFQTLIIQQLVLESIQLLVWVTVLEVPKALHIVIQSSSVMQLESINS